MDNRKRLIKLFKDITKFIEEDNLEIDSYSFLLHKFYLAINKKRASASSLKNINRKAFSILSRKFEDRLSGTFIRALSLTAILTLPSEKTVSFATESLTTAGSNIFILSDKIVLPFEFEKQHTLYLGYAKKTNIVSPFDSIVFTPVSRDSKLNISFQTTLFEIINHNATLLKPSFFDAVIDETIFSSFPVEDFINNIPFLLKPEGKLQIHMKKNFFLSSSNKKDKEKLYQVFDVNRIVRHDSYLDVELMQMENKDNKIEIHDKTLNRNISINKSDIQFNPLFTFNDHLSIEEFNILKKIEAKANGTCGDFFKYFLGMFPKKESAEKVETLRKNSKFKPFIRARDVELYQPLSPGGWIVPEDDNFHQIPPTESMESKKLILKYLSSRPQFVYDDKGLYFLRDIAAIIPKTEDTLLEYTEAYLNSNLLTFYYLLRFPQNNKFLKKNFKKIPFVNSKKHIQEIIQQSVFNLRSSYRQRALFAAASPGTDDSKIKEERILNNYIYQLFNLTREEVQVVEAFLKKH